MEAKASTRGGDSAEIVVASRFTGITICMALLMLGFLCSCGRPPDTTTDASSNSGGQKLPFDRQPHSAVASPSQSLIPSSTKLPEGTPIPIRLNSALSSASSHAGDMFDAIIDEPVVVDGITVVADGTPARGRVLEAKASGGSTDPGYLRVVLVSLNAGKKPVMIYTSSVFAKGGPREERNPASGAAFDNAKGGDVKKDKDVVFTTDRRLNFRLAQTVDLQ